MDVQSSPKLNEKPEIQIKIQEFRINTARIEVTLCVYVNNKICQSDIVI